MSIFCIVLCVAIIALALADKDACENIDCGGNSTCRVENGTYACECAEGWNGGGVNTKCEKGYCKCTGNQGFYKADDFNFLGGRITLKGYDYDPDYGNWCGKFDEIYYDVSIDPSQQMWTNESWCYIRCDSKCSTVKKIPTHKSLGLWKAELNGVDLCYSYENCGGVDYYTTRFATECRARGGWVTNLATQECTCDTAPETCTEEETTTTARAPVDTTTTAIAPVETTPLEPTTTTYVNTTGALTTASTSTNTSSVTPSAQAGPGNDESFVAGTTIGIVIAILVVIVIGGALFRYQTQKSEDTIKPTAIIPTANANSAGKANEAEQDTLPRLSTKYSLQSIRSSEMEKYPLFLYLLADAEMALLMEGIEKDDPTYFARLGVCPNDHIYARNTLSGLQAEVEQPAYIDNAAEKQEEEPYSPATTLDMDDEDSRSEQLSLLELEAKHDNQPQVPGSELESEAKYNNQPRRITTFVDLKTYIIARNAPNCKEWLLTQATTRKRNDLNLPKDKISVTFFRDKLNEELGTLAEVIDPKHTYKLPLPDVAPLQPSIGVILMTANPSCENVVPISQRTFKSSNYKRHYQKSSLPEFSHVLLAAVLEIVKLYFARQCLTAYVEETSSFFKKMQDEAFNNAESLANNVDIAAELLWTSALKSTALQMEICTLINAVIRDDIDEEMPACCIICRAINARRSIRNNKISIWEQQFPPEGKTYRGGGFDNSVQPFFTCAKGEQKSYRVPGFLATSGSQQVAQSFAAKVPAGRPRVMWTIELDPRGRQDVAFRVKNMTFVNHSHVKGEGEYLFAPYSVFHIKKTKWSADTETAHEITLIAAMDNLAEPEELPLAPWY